MAANKTFDVERRLLILASRDKDATLTLEMLTKTGIKCVICSDLRALAAELEVGAGALLTVEEVLAQGGHQLMQLYVHRQPAWADLPILILTHRGANSPTAILATETLGNVTLLERPIRRMALLSAIRSALRARAKQYEIRAHIAHQERITEALKESEQLYRGIGESINYGVWTCDAAGNNTYASDSFLRLTGLTQEQCSEFKWKHALHPDDAEQTIADWQTCVENGGLWDREHRIKGVDGCYHPILARGVPIHDESGKIIRWVGINLDISNLKQAQELLADADRRKDDFLATLAHELRNPLAPIRNIVELLYRTDQQELNLTSIRDVLHRQSWQLTRLVDDLLDVARITKGGVELQKMTVDLATVIQSAIEASNVSITAAHHTFNLHVNDELLLLEGDPVRLAQSLSNLLNNSAKFTPAGGSITMDVARDGQEAVITITDSGIGITAKTLPNIFNMFTQAQEAKEHAQGGLGIGLGLVKQFVEMHDGTVSAQSAGIGKGSQFIVRLPLLETETDTEIVDSWMSNAIDMKAAGHRILVVDDNQDGADSLSLLLTLSGAEVSTAYDGVEAVESAARFFPDVIILDIGLPKLNGYEAARQIRSLPGGDRMTLIAATGWGQAVDRRKTEEAGFDHHLVKPIELSALISLLP